MKKTLAAFMALLMVAGIISPAMGIISAFAVDTNSIVADGTAADPSTSAIEDEFHNSLDENGMIVADKTVKVPVPTPPTTPATSPCAPPWM